MWSRQVSEDLGYIKQEVKSISKRLDRIERSLQDHDDEIHELKQWKAYVMGYAAAAGAVISVIIIIIEKVVL